VRPGEVADLVAVRADDLLDAVAGPSGSRVVLRRGRVVASTSVDQRTAVDPGPMPTWRSA
jgi:cytosine/adenosine deaminase-related metal-dependent hydrolase